VKQKSVYVVVVVLVALVSPLSACSGDRERKQKAEVARVAHAVDVLREAPNEAKRPLLKALQATACVESDACELRRVCGDAYASHLAAIEGSRAVSAQLQAGVIGNERDIAQLMAASKRALELGKQQSHACTELESTLKRRYRL
jgi:hypothetical protein